MPYRKKNSLKLVIFDLDGVVCDSELLHKDAKLTILKEYTDTENLDLSWSVGIPGRDMWTRLIQDYQIKLSPDELERMQYDLILDLMQEQDMRATTGLMELLIWLKTKHIQIGMCSSSNRYYVDRILDRYKLRDLFDFVVAGDEVPQKKPAPDGYLKVLELAGLPAKNAMAIEDSRAGSIAAKSAGIVCIGYRNPTSGKQDLSRATWIVDELHAIPSFLYERIPGG